MSECPESGNQEVRKCSGHWCLPRVRRMAEGAKERECEGEKDAKLLRKRVLVLTTFLVLV